MEENLSGYLLGALDPHLHAEVEQYLRDNPEGERRLQELKHTLDQLALDKDDESPPRSLRFATLSRIAEHRCRTLPQAPRPSRSHVGSRRSRWRRADVAVAAAMLFVVGGLAFPLISRWVHQERIMACQDNLRGFHVALVNYSDKNNGAFPKLGEKPPFDFAGVYALMLDDSGDLPANISLGCPANGKHGPVREVCAAKLAEMESCPQERCKYREWTKKIGGCYAYSLGYQETINGVPTYFGLRHNSGDDLPIMSDRPPFSEGVCRGGNSLNHGGAGQNVLYIGGNVRYCTTRSVGRGGDDIFANSHNFMAAGIGIEDSVLGPSEAHPCPMECDP